MDMVHSLLNNIETTEVDRLWIFSLQENAMRDNKKLRESKLAGEPAMDVYEMIIFRFITI